MTCLANEKTSGSNAWPAYKVCVCTTENCNDPADCNCEYAEPAGASAVGGGGIVAMAVVVAVATFG